MKVADKLAEMYDGYYANGEVQRKREVTARQTVRHIESILSGRRFSSLIDVGAGDGAVLVELDGSSIAEETHALEIYASGCEAIRSRSLSRIKSVRQFDGYHIDNTKDAFQFGTAIHVLEHVEHERAFLTELCRACELVYIEVPLELTLRTDRSISLSAPYGHINFYTPTTFVNLLRTAGLEVLDLKVFANSVEYEKLLGGAFRGGVKHLVRNGLLKLAPSIAPFLMTFLAGALCTQSGRSKPLQ